LYIFQSKLGRRRIHACTYCDRYTQYARKLNTYAQHNLREQKTLGSYSRLLFLLPRQDEDELTSVVHQRPLM